MMLSVAKLAVGQERYYSQEAGERIDVAASVGDGREDYYLDPPRRAVAGLGPGRPICGWRARSTPTSCDACSRASTRPAGSICAVMGDE
jgi:hypothetical protein